MFAKYLKRNNSNARADNSSVNEILYPCTCIYYVCKSLTLITPMYSFIMVALLTNNITAPNSPTTAPSSHLNGGIVITPVTA